jgi:hypothetical protein
VQLSTFAEQTRLQGHFFTPYSLKKSPKAVSQPLYEEGPTKQYVNCKEQESEQGS